MRAEAWRWWPLSQTHSPESPVVAVVSLFAVGGTLVLTLLVTNTQSTEIGSGVSPRGAALAEEFIWAEGRGYVSAFGQRQHKVFTQQVACLGFSSVCGQERKDTHHHGTTFHHQPQTHWQPEKPQSVGRDRTVLVLGTVTQGPVVTAL